MVCTVVLSVVQDRHGYEVWISRCRHVAASCLITIFVIFCHETDFQSPSLRSALAERAGRDLELRREKSSRVRFDSNSTIQTSLSPLPPSSSPIPRSSNRSIDRCYDFLTSIRVDDSLCYLNCIYIYMENMKRNKFYPISLSSFVEFFRRHRRRVISIYVYIAYRQI